MSRRDLVAWLDDYLRVRAIPDKSLNGLQLEGRDEVSRVAVAVDSTLATIEAAADAGADFLICHHGWFWGQPLPIVGPHARRVRAALDAGVSVYAAHLPLDVHPEVGNNVEFARAMGLSHLEPFAEVRGLSIGVRGSFAVPVSLEDLADAIQRVTGEVCLVHAGGPGMVRSVGVVTGAGADLTAQTAAAGLDAFVTGEPSHAHFADPFEYGVNAVFAGHYVTEMLGVRSLAMRIEDTFGVPWQFLHLPTAL